MIIESDSSTTVAILNKDRVECPWTLKFLFANCQNIIHSFRESATMYIMHFLNMSVHIVPKDSYGPTPLCVRGAWRHRGYGSVAQEYLSWSRILR